MPASAEILRDPSLTFVEKVVALNAADGGRVYRPGEIAVLNADLAMAQDSTGPLAIKVLAEMGITRLWDPKRVLLVIDHTYPASDEKIATLHQLIRRFAAQQACELVEGSISHQHVLEEHAAPGMIIFGADSHTCQAGCVGAFATGVGSTEMAALWATGQMWVRVPETLRIQLTGKLRPGVYARDAIVKLIGEIGEDGANYRALEWHGPGVKTLTLDSRACISNASMECSAKLSVFQPDATTDQFLRNVTRDPKQLIYSGPKAEYVDNHDLALDQVEPVVAAPHSADNVKAVREVEGTPIDQAFVGSATNGRLEDLQAAARILKGHRVRDGTRCIITPASPLVYDQALRSGLVQTFLAAGAVFTNATCGACVGTHLGALAAGETCIASSSRNYIGRMGSVESRIYMASPATVAASAIEGKIADPRRYL